MSSNQQLLQLLSPIQIQQQLQKLQHKQHKIQQEISKSAQQITENSFQKQQHDLSTSWPPQQFDNNNNNVDNKKHFKLSYVDFPPRCAGAGNVICNPDYEKFDSLLKKANEWLRQHPYLKVKTCESVEVKGRYDGVVDTNKSCFFEADHSKRRMRNLFVRVLRLWVVHKEDTDPEEAQQLGYVNLVPSRNELGAFENFGDTVRKFNCHLRNKPLPGKILNVETQEMKFHEWGVGVEPDESCWVESVKFNISFLVVIRVFFQLGPPALEEIGCADFVPSNLDQGSHFSVPSFEKFEKVFNKASSWIRFQRNINVINIQSIDYKMKNDFDASNLDTQRSFFVESGRYTTKYLRILRVCFTRSFQQQLLSRQPQQQQQLHLLQQQQLLQPQLLQQQLLQQQVLLQPPQYHLLQQNLLQKLQEQYPITSPSSQLSNQFSNNNNNNEDNSSSNSSSNDDDNPYYHNSSHPITECRYVTFEPMMISSGGIIGIPLFERLSETMKRAMNWLNDNKQDLKLISAETVPVRMFSGNQYGNHEVTYTWNRGEQKEFWLLVIRLYLAGRIDVVPPNVVMPAFLHKNDVDNCCSLM